MARRKAKTSSLLTQKFTAKEVWLMRRAIDWNFLSIIDCPEGDTFRGHFGDSGSHSWICCLTSGVRDGRMVGGGDRSKRGNTGIP